jgi:phospholipid/cholesterol/gamma-HCH transport system substrate-binding protein
MNKYRREVGIEILVGLFMFTVLIALGIFTIVLSHENLLKKSHPYEFVFSEVAGLREGDNVYVRGMNIGRVKQIVLEDGHVRVYAALDMPLHLRRGYKVEVVDASMLGGKYLKVYEGPEEAPMLGENITLLGAPPIDLVGELASTVGSLKKMIDEVSTGKGTIGKLLKDEALYNNLSQVSSDAAKITARLERGEGTLGKLLVSDNGQMYEDGKVMMANLRAVSDSLAEGKGTLGKLLVSDNGQMYEDGKVLLANLRTVSDNLAKGNGMLGKLASGDDAAYEDLAATLAAIRSISESISDGEGTLGRLVRDAKLYDEATLLVEDVRAAVDDLREASPITSFGSVLFGAF